MTINQDERMKILDMLAAGKINAGEANELLSALGLTPQDTKPRGVPKFLRIQVESKGTPAHEHTPDDEGTTSEARRREFRRHHHGHHGHHWDEDTTVNVRVPFQVLRSGIRLASLMPGGVQDAINGALRENGIDIDVTQVKPDNIDELINALSEITVNVVNKKDTVKIFCEYE